MADAGGVETISIFSSPLHIMPLRSLAMSSKVREELRSNACANRAAPEAPILLSAQITKRCMALAGQLWWMVGGWMTKPPASILSSPLRIITTIVLTTQVDQGEGGVALQHLCQPHCSFISHAVACPTKRCEALADQWWRMIGGLVDD